MLMCDLSSLKSVRSLVKRFHKKYPKRELSLLINNAGLMAPPFSLSKDGFELQFAVNHLAHFLLTNLLLPSLEKHARVITLSSIAHFSGTMPFHNLPTYNDGARYEGTSAYGTSKLANVLFAYELQRRLRKREKYKCIRSYAAHPGVIRTSLWRQQSYLKLVKNFCIFKCQNDGAKSSIHAATLSRYSDARNEGGKYLSPFCCCSISMSSSKESYNEQMAAQLWKKSVQWVKLKRAEKILSPPKKKRKHKKKVKLKMNSDSDCDSDSDSYKDDVESIAMTRDTEEAEEFLAKDWYPQKLSNPCCECVPLLGMIPCCWCFF
eukprot:TRINITY_DN13658_c0_g1_i1.p1 TRINITY_DN13658_c0_g1~~TRINITY_DN13658_c0_g1_i1.p1  ORF type:complete len:320 (+),score=44.75 TRINITY_DN13658_c0_g1_i1:254-1213(+)